MRSTRASLGVIALLMAVAVMLQIWRDRGWTPYDSPTPIMWMGDPKAVQRAALGFDALVADMYWIRALVYFGHQRLSARPDKNYDLLYPLLELVTTLDPRFVVAYRFGALFLSEPPPGGPNRPDLAIRLLERGAERMPERWEYPHDLGFVHAWNKHDYAEAARWFDRAARVPGGPIWLKSTAATMLARGGDRASARQLWRQVYDSTDVEWFRESAAGHLAQFDALDAIDQLNQLVWRYRATTGRMPQSWQELVAARVLRGIPLDPAGVTFVLDPVNEDVRLDQKSPLWPLPEGYGSSTP